MPFGAPDGIQWPTRPRRSRLSCSSPMQYHSRSHDLTRRRMLERRAMSRRRYRWSLTLACLCGLLIARSRTIGAQAETYQLVISVSNCDVGADGNTSNCVPDAGVTIYVEDAAGNALGSCETQIFAPLPNTKASYCGVAVPLATTVIASQDPATIDPAFAPTQDSLPFDTPDA